MPVVDRIVRRSILMRISDFEWVHQLFPASILMQTLRVTESLICIMHRAQKYRDQKRYGLIGLMKQSRCCGIAAFHSPPNQSSVL